MNESNLPAKKRALISRRDSDDFVSTNDDDNFYFSSRDHGYSNIDGTGFEFNYWDNGSDTYNLALDVDAANRTTHNHNEGGGIVDIHRFNIYDDKIILPKGVDPNHVVFHALSWDKRGWLNQQDGEWPKQGLLRGMVELVFDPHGAY